MTADQRAELNKSIMKNGPDKKLSLSACEENRKRSQSDSRTGVYASNLCNMVLPGAYDTSQYIAYLEENKPSIQLN